MGAREQEGAYLFLELIELRSFLLPLPHARLPLLTVPFLQHAAPVLISLPLSLLSL